MTDGGPRDLGEWLHSLDSDELAGLIASAQQELVDRASRRGDLDAVVDRAFTAGFDRQGVARAPWVDHGLVVCPGSRLSGTSGSHRCRFVACGDKWVWQDDTAVADEMRPYGADLRTVTVLAAQEGLELDVVTSRARGGVHRRLSSVRLRVDGGGLVEVLRRGAGAGRDHR